MASRSEIEKQIAALQAELENSDDDTELWVEHERNGKPVKTRLSGGHAKGWLDDLLGPAAPAKGDTDDDDDEADDDGEQLDEKKPAGGGYFGKRKA